MHVLYHQSVWKVDKACLALVYYDEISAQKLDRYNHLVLNLSKSGYLVTNYTYYLLCI